MLVVPLLKFIFCMLVVPLLKFIFCMLVVPLLKIYILYAGCPFVKNFSFVCWLSLCWNFFLYAGCPFVKNVIFCMLVVPLLKIYLQTSLILYIYHIITSLELMYFFFCLSDSTFLKSWDFIWRVLVITSVSCIPLYILKFIRKKFSPPVYAKLT